jgi:hypothetical protein
MGIAAGLHIASCAQISSDDVRDALADYQSLCICHPERSEGLNARPATALWCRFSHNALTDLLKKLSLPKRPVDNA